MLAACILVLGMHESCAKKTPDKYEAGSCVSVCVRALGRWLKPWASLCLGLYGVGIPALFLTVLIFYRKEIKVDQVLRKQGLGYTRASNPHFVMRRRFQKLYSDFKPGA